MRLLLSTSAKTIVAGDRVAAEFAKNDWSIGTVLKVTPSGYRIEFDYGEAKLVKSAEMRVIAVNRKARLKKSLSLAEVRALNAPPAKTTTPSEITFDSRTTVKQVGIPAGLASWVRDYKLTRATGNVRLSKSLRTKIDKEIVRLKLDRLKVYGEDPDAPEPKAKRAAVSKLYKLHKPELLGYSRKALMKVLANRQDESEHHITSDESESYFGATSAIRLGKEPSKVVEVHIGFHTNGLGMFMLRVIVPRDNDNPKLIGRSQVVKDLVKTYESLKKFLAKKYSITLGPSQHLFSDVFTATTNGYVLSWGSKVL